MGVIGVLLTQHVERQLVQAASALIHSHPVVWHVEPLVQVQHRSGCRSMGVGGCVRGGDGVGGWLRDCRVARAVPGVGEAGRLAGGRWAERGRVIYLGAGSGGGMRTLNENPVNKVANYGETSGA